MLSTFTRFLLILTILGFQSIAYSQNSKHFVLPPQATERDYLKNTIILKIKSDYREHCTLTSIDIPELLQVFNTLGVATLEKKFPQITPQITKRNEQGQEFADLSMIYEINYLSNTSITTAINMILATASVEYAQPHYIQKPLDYFPSDPLNFNQYHLALINAFKAWDVSKGDTNIVIGISDWGTDTDHPDLVNNVKYNKLDPIDGADNDNDGYIDNYGGWDLGENDNNPQGITTHGCFVAGLSSASTDNNIGLSGTGFLCKYLPLKVSDANNEGTKTFESIVYAVEHGCSIVNCSWGNTFNTGPFGQDVVDYATINKGALVVAACGNDDNMVPFYPASYKYVLSVAASNSNDIKWSGSSYGYFVDITAPGESVWSTYDGGTYGSSSGTSFSAPIVSGCAALLKSKYPNLTGLQIGERIKVSADVIDTASQNLPYKDLMGSGRVNIFKALTDSTHPSIQFQNYTIADFNNDGAFAKGDTLIIKGGFINYLAPSSSNLKVTLSCLSPNTRIIDSVVNLGAINTLSIANNNSDPFTVYLKPTLTTNEELIFKLKFSDNNYKAIQYLYLVVNINYLNIDTNQIATTISSEGMIGYNNGNCTQGLGFRYNNSETLLFMGGFIAGKSTSAVSDALYASPLSNGFEHDFKSIENIHKINNPTLANYEAYGVFDDSRASSPLGILVKQKTFAWAVAPKDKFVILQYTIINKGTADLTNLYAGVYMDWEIGNSLKNLIEYDDINRMGYCYSIEGGTYTGVSLITSGIPNLYGMDNNIKTDNILISDGFSNNEKYYAITKNRKLAGFPYGNDVSQMLSSKVDNLKLNDSVTLAFALLAGDHLNDLQNSAIQARQEYYQTGIAESASRPSDDIILYQNEPNPFNNQTKISFYLNKASSIELSFYDIRGSQKQSIYKGKLDKGTHSFELTRKLSPGMYIYSLTTEGCTANRRMIVIQ